MKTSAKTLRIEAAKPRNPWVLHARKRPAGLHEQPTRRMLRESARCRDESMAPSFGLKDNVPCRNLCSRRARSQVHAWKIFRASSSAE